jgi:hypothetical protein
MYHIPYDFSMMAMTSEIIFVATLKLAREAASLSA